MHYYQLGRDIANFKKTGYRMAVKQMAIPVGTIKKKDSVMFAKAIWPFMPGKQDNTKIPGFAEEKRFAVVQYSANIAATLYTVSNAFKLTLDPKDKALSNALVWMHFACRIYQNHTMLKLKSELEVIQQPTKNCTLLP